MKTASIYIFSSQIHSKFPVHNTKIPIFLRLLVHPLSYLFHRILWSVGLNWLRLQGNADFSDLKQRFWKIMKLNTKFSRVSFVLFSCTAIFLLWRSFVKVGFCWFLWFFFEEILCILGVSVIFFWEKKSVSGICKNLKKLDGYTALVDKLCDWDFLMILLFSLNIHSILVILMISFINFNVFRAFQKNLISADFFIEKFSRFFRSFDEFVAIF